MGNNTRLLEDIRAAQAKLKVSSQAIISAHNTFTTEFNTFLSFSTVLEMQFEELEQRELKVEKREKEVKIKSQQVEEREKRCAVREQQVEQREQEVAEKERKWIETEKQMKDNAAKLPTVIQFNVCMNSLQLIFIIFLFIFALVAGGSKFAISKEKLLEYKGSLFDDCD